MLKAIKELIAGVRDTSRQHTDQPSIGVPAGYFMPASAEQLLDTAPRKQCLQQLWESSALPKDLYEHFYLQPLKHLVALMQVLPASRQGEYAREGGLVDVMLQTATFTVRLAKGHMLPPGIAPEEQSAQNVLWNAVVFYAALCWYLPLFNQLEGELQSGRVWLPGLTIPGEPYRFRFRGYLPENALTISQSAMIAARLVPTDAIDWLSTLPAAVQTLMLIATRQPGSLPMIDDIVQEAAGLARGTSLLSVISLSDSPIASTPMSPSLQADTVTDDSLVPRVNLQSTVNLPPVESPPGETVDNTDTEEQQDVNESAVADTILSSALDEPLNEPLAETVIVPETAANIEENTQVLLSIMAVAVPAAENKARGQPEITDGIEPVDRGLTKKKCEDVAVVEVVAPPGKLKPVKIHPSEEVSLTVRTPTETKAPGRSGEKFWQWLSDGLIAEKIPVNTPDARVHLVSGFVFITVPGIFYLYLKNSGLEGNQREAVQEDFERLERHRRIKGKRFYFSHLYESSEHSGPFKRTKGYLVKAGLLYRGKSVPDDSPVLVIP